MPVANIASGKITAKIISTKSAVPKLTLMRGGAKVFGGIETRSFVCAPDNQRSEVRRGGTEDPRMWIPLD
jgi:hypothetical protein